MNKEIAEILRLIANQDYNAAVAALYVYGHSRKLEITTKDAQSIGASIFDYDCQQIVSDVVGGIVAVFSGDSTYNMGEDLIVLISMINALSVDSGSFSKKEIKYEIAVRLLEADV